MDERSQHADLVRAHFDEHSNAWDRLYREPKIAHDLVLRDRNDIAVDFLAAHLAPGSRVLDAGCGAGVTCRHLAERGFAVHGVDIADGMVKLCRQQFARHELDRSQYEFSVGDINRNTLPAESFDGIAALGFLEYQENEGESLAALHRLLRPGGVAVLSGPIATRISNLFGLSKYYKRWRTRGRAPAVLSVNTYTLKRFTALLSAADFTLMAYRRHGYANFQLPYRFKKALDRVRGEFALHRGLTALSRVLPVDRFANDIVVMARKTI